MNEHERGFLEFIAEPSRERMKTLLELGDKRRLDVVSLLHNAVRLDARFCEQLKGSNAFAGPIEAVLRARGAPAICHVITAGDLDGRDMPLRDALDAICGWGGGAFVSCIPGHLGYYEYADIKSSYLLCRER